MRSSPRSLARRAHPPRRRPDARHRHRHRRVASPSRRVASRPPFVVVVVVVVVAGRRALTPNGSHRPPRRARILFFVFFVFLFAEIRRRPGAPRRRGRGGGSVGRWWTDFLNPKFGNEPARPRARSRDRGAGEARERDGIVRAAAGETGMRVRCVMYRSVARARWIGGGKGRVERTRGSAWRGMRGEGISTRAFGGDARAWGGCSNARERSS